MHIFILILWFKSSTMDPTNAALTVEFGANRAACEQTILAIKEKNPDADGVCVPKEISLKKYREMRQDY